MGTKFIRIEGEAVSAVEETIHRRTTLPEWLAALNKLSPVAMTTPALPEGTVLYAQKGIQQLVVINQPAAVRKVIWRTTVYRDAEQRNKTRWALAVPPHVFLLVFTKDAIHSSHIYFVPKPVTDEKDMLYYTSLANVYFQPQGMPTPICSGSIRLDVKASFAARCQQFITAFWETEFNDDIQPVVHPRLSGNSTCIFARQPSPPQLLNLHAWDKATADNPNFLTEMSPWPFAPLCTLSEILNERWVV
jgi:hypothetical protein